MFYYDPSYFLLIPALIFSMIAQNRVNTTFNKYLRVRSQKGYTGVQVARKILDANGLQSVNIEFAKGRLSDHYDPRKRVLRLSNEVYNGTSVASLGVAAHEVGHAIQHATGYAPLSIRNSIAPIAGFGSQAAWMLFLMGILFDITNLMTIGIWFFIAVVFFQIITLPVEFNASNRAIALLQSQDFLTPQEVQPTKKVLNAAALTYVAATLTAVSQLLRLLVLRGRRD